jgi:Mg/Co/Ni transporter MgtE
VLRYIHKKTSKNDRKAIGMAHLKTPVDQPVIEVARKDFTELRPEFTVREALNYIRSQQVGEKIVYFYVVGEDGRLVGVLPTRRLLTTSPDQTISELMITRVVTIPQKATVLDACEFFIMHKFLAFPVVDEQRRMVGLVDVSIFTEEVFVLGLGESVAIQSMTVAVQSLRAVKPSAKWYLRALRRESGTALMLGGACGTVVGLIAWLWRGEGLSAIAIGASIALALFWACFFGLSIPSVLHALKLDPKIAAGPMTLALADIFTILSYFSLAAYLL